MLWNATPYDDNVGISCNSGAQMQHSMSSRSRIGFMMILALNAVGLLFYTSSFFDYHSVSVSPSLGAYRLDEESGMIDAQQLSLFHMAKWGGDWDPESVQVAISPQMINAMEDRFKNSHVHIKIIGNEVYYKWLMDEAQTAWYVKYRIEESVKEIYNASRNLNFDHDLDLFLGLDDNPYSTDSTWNEILSGFPVFATRYSEFTVDMPYPDPLDLHPSYNLEETNLKPFEDKISKAVFRGATTNYILRDDNWQFAPRFKISFLSEKYPELIDAGISSYSYRVSESVRKELGESGFKLKHPMNSSQIFNYKYILDIDGGLGSARTCSILRSSSLLIRHKSPFPEYFLPALKDGIHFVEVERNFVNLVEKIKYLNAHPVEVKQMIKNANEAAQLYCTHEGRVVYWREYLKLYSKLLVNATRTVASDFERLGGWNKTY
jgi:hypothetical protein